MTAEVVDTVEAVKAKGVGATTDHVVHALALVAEGEGAGANHAFTLWLSWPAEHELQVDHTAHVLVLLAKGTGATADLIVLQVYPVVREAGAMTNSVPELLLREQVELESWILISLTAWRHWNT